MAKVDPEAPVTRDYLDGAIRPITKLLDKIMDKLDEHDSRFDEAAAERQALEAKVIENSRKIDDLRKDLSLTS